MMVGRKRPTSFTHLVRRLYKDEGGYCFGDVQRKATRTVSFDLWGVADGIAFNEREVILLQWTHRDRWADHVKTILEWEGLSTWLEHSGRSFHLLGFNWLAKQTLWRWKRAAFSLTGGIRQDEGRMSKK